MKYSIFSLFLFFLLASCEETSEPLPQYIEDEINRRIDLKLNPSISIGILQADGKARFFNYNHEDIEIKADKQTLYEIGSITKTFTSYLLETRLISDKNSTLNNYFPKIDNEILDSITLHDLQNHIAGVPRLSEGFSPKDWSDPFNGYSDEILYEDLNSLTMSAQGRWAYSNLGYSILGKSLEVNTNRNFNELMGDLLQNTEMYRTYLNHKNFDEQKMAKPYNVGTENSYWKFTGPSRYAGGLISCTKDMINYLRFQRENNILFKQDIINPIQTNVPNLGDTKLFYNNGWFVLKPNNDQTILLHNGGTGGFISFIGYNTKTNQGVVILANGLEVVDDIGLSIIYPEFELGKPKRSIAFEIADLIEEDKADNLQQAYKQFLEKGQHEDIIDVYWLERYHFGKENYNISMQLSEIMVEVLPEDWEVFDIKAQNLEKLNQFEKAVEFYKKAQSLNPDSIDLEKKIKRCEEKLS